MQNLVKQQPAMQNAEDLECHEQKRAGKHALPQKWLPIMPPNAMLILVQMPRFINRKFFLKKKTDPL
jgi:hypothetical protein